MAYQFYTYLLASKRYGTLYVGVTNNLSRRIMEHKQRKTDGFTAKYDVNILVWFEKFDYIDLAIQREKNIKNWKRAWKIELIEKSNPNWDDLYSSIFID